MAVRVRIEQVIRARIVLIDGALDEAHAENARVEVEVLLCWARDGGDVMQSVHSLHPARIPRLEGLVLRAWGARGRDVLDDEQLLSGLDQAELSARHVF